jgi:hypothetical protein
MTMSAQAKAASSVVLPNGPGAAAILAAGIGAFMLAVFAVTADKVPSVKSLMNIWKPTGPLSGVTTCAIVIWLIAWAILDWRWHRETVDLARINTIALILLALSLLLTFPPIADLL